MIAFRVRVPSKKWQKLINRVVNFTDKTKKKKKSFILSESHFFGHIKYLVPNNSCHILTAFIHMDPKHIPRQCCALQMLNGPQDKKKMMLHISHAASVPDVFSVRRCWFLLHITEFISLFWGLQGRLPRAGSEGQRAGSREGSHCGERPGRGLSGCDGHHEGMRLLDVSHPCQLY